MKTTMTSCLLLLAILFGVQQCMAGEILGFTGQTCYPINFRNSGVAPCISVYGHRIENIDRVTTSASGLFVKIVGKYNGQQNNSGPFAGKGRVDLVISISNGSPGISDIVLIKDPVSGQPAETSTFGIRILAPPTISYSVPEATPNAPFDKITVNLVGPGLQLAKTPAEGTLIKNDPLIPFITTGGDADIQRVEVLSSSRVSLKAQIFFTARVQDVTVELALRSDDECVPLGVRPVPPAPVVPFKTRVRITSSNMKNYVKAITLPGGNTFDKNSTGRIVFNLLFPAPQSGGGTINDANRTVFFKLVPAHAFSAVAHGTPYNVAGFTQVVANAGSNSIPITFNVADCLGTQPGTTSTVKIQAWMHNPNSTVAPEFVEQAFQVRCTQ